MGVTPAGFKASSFSPKSLGPKHATKGKKVLAKGRGVSNISNISKTAGESNHQSSASLTPLNHCASLTFMGAKMCDHTKGLCHGSGSSGEGSGKDSKIEAMEAVQFNAQRSPKRRPTVIKKECEAGFVDVLHPCEISEFESFGVNSKVLMEDGEGDFNLLGSSVLIST